MIGAIIGDMVGSPYEFRPIKTKRFPLFSAESCYTDDTLMTIAVGRALRRAATEHTPLGEETVRAMRRMGQMYPSPKGGYGIGFSRWLQEPSAGPYGSYGNGAAMRASPCGEAAESLEQALAFAKDSAEVTHNHPEGVKGAQAVAAAVFLARQGATKDDIRGMIQAEFYPLRETVAQIRPGYVFDETCQGTVPQALTAFLESESFEDALRNAVSLGGDCDTLTSITCAVAWPFYARAGMDAAMTAIGRQALKRLPADLRRFVLDWESHGAFAPQYREMEE